MSLSLYALCDQTMLDQKGVSLENFVELCYTHNAKVIQYRNKNADHAVIKAQLQTLRSLWKKTLIINDVIDLTPLCDGVHIGQEDLQKLGSDPEDSILKLRQRIGADKWIGLSTHNKEEILAANKLDLDYIGLGAYRSSGTKTEAKVLGEDLDTIAAFSTHNVSAIGGIHLSDKFQHVTYLVIGSGLLASVNVK